MIQQNQPKPIRLTRRERRLVERVALGVKPTQAMRDIGFTGKRPDVAASKMMAKPHVRAELERLESRALETAGVTRAWIVNELRKLASASLYDESGKPKDPNTLDADTASAVSSIDYGALTAKNEQGEDIVRTYIRKARLINRKDALAELAVISGLKRGDGAQAPNVGPGLTVIVQQGVQVNGKTNVEERRVEVKLPRPK